MNVEDVTSKKTKADGGRGVAVVVCRFLFFCETETSLSGLDSQFVCSLALLHYCSLPVSRRKLGSRVPSQSWGFIHAPI